MQTFPIGMGEPLTNSIKHWIIHTIAYLHQYRLEEDKQEEIETTEYVQGLYTFLRLLHGKMGIRVIITIRIYILYKPYCL